MESLSTHLVGQLLLESVEPPESILELAAILLAGPTAHPTPWDASSHQAALLDQQVTALLTLHLELLVDGVG